MLDVSLDSISHSIVVAITFANSEIDQETESIVEAEHAVETLLLLDDVLEELIGDSAGVSDVSRSTIVAVTVLGVERLNADTILDADYVGGEVLSAAVIALVLGLLDCRRGLGGDSQVHTGVHSTSVLLQHFNLEHVSGEVDEDESFSGCVIESEELERDLLLDQAVLVALLEHALHSEEERVIELVHLPSQLLDIAQDGLHRDEGHAEVDG